MDFFGGLEDDLGDLGPLVREELLTGIHAEAVMASQRQRNIAEANDRIAQAAVEGLGQKMMSVDLGLWHYWQIREPGCWNDPAFRREVLRDNPDTRVKYTPRTTSLRVDGFRDNHRAVAARPGKVVLA